MARKSIRDITRRAKIICTVGPASRSSGMLVRMMKAGMNLARLNFSHGTPEEHRQTILRIRRLAEKHNRPLAILQDLRGLKIRVGPLEGGGIVLKKNAVLSIAARPFMGTGTRISLTYPNLIRDVSVGNRILIDDGLIQLRVVAKGRTDLSAKVLEGGFLRERKGVNLPGTKITGEVFTRKDRQDLQLGLSLGVDYIALSFVRSERDIKKVRKWLKKQNREIPIIAKIENRHALERMDEIIRSADGLMVARGDLGVEVPAETVPLIQKDLIERCNAAMKPVITATQMLESMTEHLSPTRAEATDVANAVLDGTDALMLSAETSIGKYPVEAVSMMSRIIQYTEQNRKGAKKQDILSGTFPQALAEAACQAALDIQARTIVAFSRSGFTALLVSKFRPHVPITVFTETEEAQRMMSLYWGIQPEVMKFPNNTDEMISRSEQALLRKRIVRKGDPVVIIASSPFALGGKANVMKLHKVGY